jgi:Peptidase family M23/Bacterial SH3 domain
MVGARRSAYSGIMPRTRSLSWGVVVLAWGCASGAEMRSDATAAWDGEESSSGSSSSAAGEGSDAPGSSTAPASTSPAESDDDGSSDDGPTPAPDLPPANDCPRVKITVMPGNALNVRPEPSTAGDPVGELPNNAVVDALGETTGEAVDGIDTWYEVDHDGVHGFVSAVYASCTLEDPPELEPPDGFYLPLECDESCTIAQGNFGSFTHQGNAAYAFDFSVPIETPLVAMADGLVAYTFDETGPGDPCYNGGGAECFAYGNLVVLRHGDGTTSLYKHLNRVDVTVGELVPRGHAVGLSGSTGYSTGPHAHVMRMEDCGMAQCQSIPLEFVEAGVPATGESVTSENCP